MKKALTDRLGGVRHHVLGILDELDEGALTKPALPSGWTCLGLVRHLALDVERFWFRAVIAGDRAVIDALSGDSWQVPPGTPAHEILDLYRTETARSDEILRAADLAAAPAWWPDFFGDYHLDTVGEVVTHVLTETATHAGHLDAARELIDGRQWLVLS
ncbi:MAG: DUF664 domain-containing protein [Hamadaea sp.]|nr:DUF664 domain-containing protein [Hamadaea sp.]